jgi:myo-inositol-1(or 4)-monophosphatase
MSDQALFEQLRQTAHAAAWQAGKIIRERNNQPRKIKMKGPRDIVTDTDADAQRAAIAVILDRFPDHRILAEEDPASNKPGADGLWHIPGGVAWIIDPLDGTSNFASGLPLICVSIGVAVDGRPVAGAIYDPLREEMFEAALGLGATLNGRPLDPVKPVKLEDALINHDWARQPEARAHVLETITRLSPHCRTIRALGSAALGLAYVAAGRIQLHFNFGLMPWDTAAGAAIVREAGGDLRSPDGSAWDISNPSLIAAHPELLDEALGILLQT